MMAGEKEHHSTRLTSADAAIVNGDLRSLEALLHDHAQSLRRLQPAPWWLSGCDAADAPLDGREILVRAHEFESWDQFAAFAHTMKNDSAIARFEQAVDAIVAGDGGRLERLLLEDPDLVRRRSLRKHHSTLLHYIGANGVEMFRQRTPQNVVQVAEILIHAACCPD